MGCGQCPTTIVPFSGDQHFWGSQIHGKGGWFQSPSVSLEKLVEFSLEKLVAAINFMLNLEVFAPSQGQPIWKSADEDVWEC